MKMGAQCQEPPTLTPAGALLPHSPPYPTCLGAPVWSWGVGSPTLHPENGVG